jgi:hypothetical protein
MNDMYSEINLSIQSACGLLIKNKSDDLQV